MVVPAYRAGSTLSRCLASLLNQRFDGTYEVVVCASADEPSTLPRPPDDPRLRLLTHVPRLGAAAARNRAAATARGELIAFTDADVVAEPDWLARLAGASSRFPCVAGSVRNGTPASVVGTAEYLLEFIDLHPRRRPRDVHFGATCNLLLRRDLWEEWGPFPEYLHGGEDTLLTVRLRKRGLFGFEPQAAVRHLNRCDPRSFLTHQYGFGRFTARLALLGPEYSGGSVRSTLTRYPSLAPVAAALRVAWVYGRLATVEPSEFLPALRCAPAVTAGSLAWAAGLVAEQLWDRRHRSSREPQDPGDVHQP